MTILLSNDDGVTSSGLKSLYHSLSLIEQCSVVAPDNDCSGMSSCITLTRPLRVKRHDNGFMSVDGTPTDAVHLAVNTLLKEVPDRVISGINLGPNLGDDVLYSGTVAAAFEGRFLAKNALAVSSCGDTDADLSVAARVITELYPRFNRLECPIGTVLNINVPALRYVDIKGIKITRLGRRGCSERPIKMEDPRGKEIYWVAPVGKVQDNGEGTDFHAIESGYVSITPLNYDKTYHRVMSFIEQRLGVML